MTPLICQMVRVTPDPESGYWFDMGDTTRRPDGHVPDAEMFNLPYRVCFVTGHQSDGTAAVLRLQTSDKGESLSVVGFVVGPSKDWRHEIEPFLVTRVADGLQISQPDGTEPTDKSEHEAALQHVEDFLLSLRAERTAYIPKARPSLINSKRAAKGKAPILFDWRTVNVQPANAKSADKGGTHASPRLHDRRGHWRKYPSGKVGWVKSCRVGDASRGVVFKDYRLTP